MAISVPCPDGAPNPTIVAGSSRPTPTLIALLFMAVLSVAAPLPRPARYTAATAFRKTRHRGEDQGRR